jgi:hypothetical protein
MKQEFGRPIMEYMERYIFIMNKCNVADDRRMAILWFNSLQKYAQCYLRGKLELLRQGTVRSSNEPIQPGEGLGKLMELLETIPVV